MLNSLKANEIATIKAIEDKIRDAAIKGGFQISLSELTNNAKTILLENGYDIVTITSGEGEVTRYDVSWNR